MALQKHPFIYQAAARAIDEFGDANHMTGRKHFASLLGFRGENASVQLSSHLNCTTYNPASPKPLTVDHLTALADELDEEHRRDMIERIVNHWGYVLCDNRRKSGPADVMSVVMHVLDLGDSFGGMESTVKAAIEDGEIDTGEARDIGNVAFEIRKIAKMIEEMMRVEEKEQ